MTLEENSILRKQLEDWGFFIATYHRDKVKWCAKLPTPYNSDMAVVDCSYDNMAYIKYRVRLFKEGQDYIESELYVRKKMEDCTVKEVLDRIGPPAVFIKRLQEQSRLDDIEEDF